VVNKGELISSLAEEYCEDYQEHCGKPRIGALTLVFCILCAGSEVVTWCARDLCTAHNAVFGEKLELIHGFSCEIDEEKRREVMKITKGKICIFKDVLHLGDTKAPCHTHGCLCEVPYVDMIIVGLSCEDLSKMNCNRHLNRQVLNEEQSKGGTAATFRGLLLLLDAKQEEISMVLGEEVAELANESADAEFGGISNKDIFAAQLSSRNFECQFTKMDCSMWGMPRSRPRLYFTAANTLSPKLDFAACTVGEFFLQEV
jgi:site-specific DNA-cytosine methylase